MIATLGFLSLCLALFCAFLQSAPTFWGYFCKQPHALAFARPAAIAQCVFIAIAYGLLLSAFINDDFSLIYVAANSHASLPMLYKVTAIWGGHEGSILLWVFLLSVWSLVFALSQRNHILLPLTLATLGTISLCFLGFLLFTSNPFLLASTPQMGRDLNPLLQDPGFVIHPPMLYAGYVGFSVAFATSLAALLANQLNSLWAALTRQFAILAWCFLTLGITLGSWWAYRVLGWGGFWFWDPVENASLLPWLAGTALIHVLILTEKRGIAQAWSMLLSIITFGLSLLGTFLVRSGVLISAHTFANDPARGIYLLMLLALVTTIALAIYLYRFSSLRKQTHFSFSWLSRESGLLINSALLFAAMLTVLLGTLYPLIFDAFKLGSISVGAPYFNTVMTPFALITLLLMGVGTLCVWQKQSVASWWQQAWKKMALSIIIAAATLWAVLGELPFSALLCLSLSLWAISSALPSLPKLPAMSIAHTGFAMLLIGVLLSSLLQQEKEARLKPGDAFNIGPYHFLFLDTASANGENYRGIRAAFDVTKNTRHITNLYPEKRIYTVRDMVMTKVDIHPSIFRDLYIALGEPLDESTWSIRLYYKPFIRWIWLGGILMLLGGLFTLIQKNKINSHAKFSN